MKTVTVIVFITIFASSHQTPIPYTDVKIESVAAGIKKLNNEEITVETEDIPPNIDGGLVSSFEVKKYNKNKRHVVCGTCKHQGCPLGYVKINGICIEQND